MTVEIIGFSSYYTMLPTSGGSPIVLSPVYKYPYPTPGGVQAKYLNKCVDGVTGLWVFWQTFFIDIDGTQYPGTSFDAGTYKIETIVYDREQ